MEISVNGATLYYEAQGSGEPVILLHGNGESHQIFDKLSEKLKKNFKLYAIDSRNHGRSEKTDDFSYATMAKDIHDFIQKLALGAVHFIGFSDGAIITLMLAMKYPEMIKKMALLGINLKPEDFTADIYREIKETYQQTNDPFCKMMLEQPDIELEDVKNVDIQTLIIAAEHDIFKPETFKNLANAMPDATLKIIPEQDHGSYIVNEDMLYPDLNVFFEM